MYIDGSIERSENASATIQWKIKDEKALALIILSVSKNELSHIRRMMSSKEAWEELIQVHSSQDPIKKAILLYRQLYKVKDK